MKTMVGTNKKGCTFVAKHSMANTETSRTIVIVGVERGGTSMVAGVIRALGVNLGDRAGRNHEDPKFLTDEKEKLLKQIELNNRKHDVWGFKVPKASMMLDFYNEALRNPYYIVVFRNIAATVDSWCTRGENDPFETGKHAIKYYMKALEDIQTSDRPALFISYERACQDVDSFVRALSDFMGTALDDQLTMRARSMVTGDGGGYLNLPEFYFHIKELLPAMQVSIPLEIEYDSDSVSIGEMTSKKISDRFVITQSNHTNFPECIYLKFDIHAKNDKLFHDDEIRVYMDFTGNFFPGHAYRPKVLKGKNLLKLETNGKVKRIAIGGIRTGIEYSVDQISVFLRADEDEDNGFVRQYISLDPGGNQPAMREQGGNNIKTIRNVMGRFVFQPIKRLFAWL